MCFHYALSAEAQKVSNRFNATFGTTYSYKKTFHARGFSHPHMPVVADAKPEEFLPFQWGLIPGWVKDATQAAEIRSMTLNAKAETVFEKPSFRNAIKKRRCIIPATGFFEWKEWNGKKYPYFISLKNEEIFAFGGIWEEWTDRAGTGEIIYSFSILTTEANPMMAEIHNTKKRMPFILPPGAEHEWLDPRLREYELKEIMRPLDENLMQAYTVSKRITSRSESSDVPEVTAPFEYPELHR